MYLLDTNVVSELRKLQVGKADPNFSAWFAGISLDLIYVSVITLFEIEHGVLLIGRRDRAQAEVLRRWFDKIQVQLEDRVLPVDQVTALHCASLNVPDPRPWRDAFIGATAHVHRMVLVTRNLRDFQGLNIQTVNPWSPSA
jgi:predicted nucleic acid-binding protein